MNTIDKNTLHDGGDIELLLPWHAAGTLDRRDVERVEQALAGDPELARRYQLVREELGEAIHLNETLGAPSARAMTALFAKIDAEPARKPSVASLNLGARVRDFFGSLSPRTLAWSATAATLAILLQAGFLAGTLIKEQGARDYQTASVPAAHETTAGSYALIQFQPKAEAAAIAQYLQDHKLRIVDGPTAGGLYRVRLAEKKLPKTDFDRIVKTLRDDKVIGFIAVTE